MVTFRVRNIPQRVHEALKVRAVREGISMETLVVKWIVEKLKETEQLPPLRSPSHEGG